MTKRSLAISWAVTLLAAIALLIATVYYFQLPPGGLVADGARVRLSSSDDIIVLRELPNENAAINAILEHGATGEVLESSSLTSGVWYRIETETGTGWVPETYLSGEN